MRGDACPAPFQRSDSLVPPKRPRSRRRQSLLISVAQPLVAGVAAHVPRHAAWDLLYCRPEELGFVTAHTPAGEIAGIILQQVQPPAARALAPPGVPVVLIDQAPQADLLGVGSDGLAIGELAFASLRARGFRRFGFWGVPGYWASDRRQIGFAGAVARAGLTMHPGSRPPLGSFRAVVAAGIAWLRAAPKPIAVLTDQAPRAAEMLWAARLARLRVPDQVAILAGAEDQLLCTLNRPAVSAIDDDPAGLGRAAAALLDEAIAGRVHRRPPPVAPRRVIERGSTETLAEVPQPVARALACIRADAHRGIGAAEVVRAAGIPRRTLELAFRTALDRSIGESIALARVARVRELLETTRLGLAEIGARVGCEDPSLLSRLFTRHVGMGAREYRQRYGLGGRR
jgi:LacI family transcriptional regulator